VAASKPREAKFTAAKTLRAQYKFYLDSYPEIKTAVDTFNAYKRTIPPQRLPKLMKDHMLKGNFAGIRECHLSDDVLLLYTHKQHEIRMLYICEHSDLYGRRARQLAAYIRDL
jgi:mRNA interferase YafQ